MCSNSERKLSIKRGEVSLPFDDRVKHIDNIAGNNARGPQR